MDVWHAWCRGRATPCLPRGWPGGCRGALMGSSRCSPSRLAAAALSQLVPWSPLQCLLPCDPPPLHTNKYLPTAPRSPCFLQRLLAHPQGPVLVGCFSWLPRGWLGVPLLGRAPPNAEGDCESPVAYQEEIYLKSDNHVGHLVKSSAVPAASCSRWELVECETKRGEAGLARQHPQRPVPDPAAGRWRRMQLRQRSGSCHGAEKCPRYVPAPGAEMQSQARVAPSQDARLEKIQKPKKKQTKSL